MARHNTSTRRRRSQRGPSRGRTPDRQRATNGHANGSGRTSRSPSPRRDPSRNSRRSRSPVESPEDRQTRLRNEEFLIAVSEFHGSLPRPEILDELHDAGKQVGRNHDLFLDMFKVVSAGMPLHNVSEENVPEVLERYENLKVMTPARRAELVQGYQKLLVAVPPLQKELMVAESDDSAISGIVLVLTSARGMARREDCEKLRYAVVEIMSRVLKPEHLTDDPLRVSESNKGRRGFNHHTTARLLVPRSKRDEYDVNPDKYRADVKTKKITITAKEMPSFLYPEDLYDSGEVDRWLFHSDLFILTYSLVWAGKRSVASDTPSGARLGRRPIGYKSKNVTAERVAYVATLLRFSLSSQEVWAEVDGAFSNSHFYSTIRRLFRDDQEWATPTLKHIEREVWGALAQDDVQDDSDGFMATVAAQRAARRQAAAAAAAVAAAGSEVDA
ncbi:hypothetical protein PsYK624_126720 [Phanerochaete sordida]|uniref:Fungal-type protein kinase domain-containing protein n=1 Tax=Phanerochaete sordida TaxID=48140 RepID=A0A9P3LIL0_9APHY|nr:hypothetical protein PsYK624_126720 [Phanerochaete sordida]